MRTFFFMAGMVLLLTACEKDPRYMSPQKFLTQKPWQLRSQQLITRIGNVRADTTDAYSLLDSCAMDDLYIYDQNGQYHREEGLHSCTPPLYADALWRYDAPAKQLILDGNARQTWEVLSLNDEELLIRSVRITPTAGDTITRIDQRYYQHP